MDRNDQQAITALFEKLKSVEQQGMPRDAEAEDFIRQQVAQQPGAPYYMAQTIVMQEQALEAAQARIDALEERGQSEGSGLLGGLFGGGASRGSVPSVGRRSAQPMGQPPLGQPGYQPGAVRSGGTGFLAGAAQTAMGVAGGMLLGSAIAGMMTGDAAAEAAEADASAGEGGGDAGGDFGGDMGGDMGDLGGF